MHSECAEKQTKKKRYPFVFGSADDSDDVRVSICVIVYHVYYDGFSPAAAAVPSAFAPHAEQNVSFSPNCFPQLLQNFAISLTPFFFSPPYFGQGLRLRRLLLTHII